MSAGFTVHWGKAVHCFRKDLGHAGLSGSPGSRKKIGMSDALVPDLIFQRVAERLDSGDYFNTVFLTADRVLADVTRTELMNSFGLISAYTTKTTNNKNRNINIQLSAQAINGTTVMPGETFSFNAATGERTSEKGYLPAAAISANVICSR